LTEKQIRKESTKYGSAKIMLKKRRKWGMSGLRLPPRGSNMPKKEKRINRGRGGGIAGNGRKRATKTKEEENLRSRKRRGVA